MVSLDREAFIAGLTFRPLRKYIGGEIDRFVSWLYITRIWGPRCGEFEPTCHCCQRWAEHDELFLPDPIKLRG